MVHNNNTEPPPSYQDGSKVGRPDCQLWDENRRWDRRCLQVNVYNFPHGTTKMLIEHFFIQWMTHATICDHPPFIQCRIGGNGRWATLEFESAYLATRALDFNGITFLRHTLRIERPSGYIVQGPPPLTWERLLAFDEGEKTKEWIDRTDELWAYYSMADLHEWDTTYRGEHEKSLQTLIEGWWYGEGRWGESTSPDDIRSDVHDDFMTGKIPSYWFPSQVKSTEEEEEEEEEVLELFDEMLNDIGKDNDYTSSATNHSFTDKGPSEHPNTGEDDQQPDYHPTNNDVLYVATKEEKVKGGGSNHSSGELGSDIISPIKDSLELVTAVSMEESELDGRTPTCRTTSIAHPQHIRLLPPTSTWQYHPSVGVGSDQPIPRPPTNNDDVQNNKMIPSCSEITTATDPCCKRDESAAANITNISSVVGVKESVRLPWQRIPCTLRRRVARKSRGRLYVRLQQLGIELEVLTNGSNKFATAPPGHEVPHWKTNGTITFTTKVDIARYERTLADGRLDEIICHFRKRGL